jgi:hybrid cluster-associated redox disulfide protein
MAKKKEKKEFVTKDWTLGETLEKYPEAMEVFAQYGMHCIGCAISVHETVEQGAEVHGMPLEEFLKKINAAIETHKKSK